MPRGRHNPVTDDERDRITDLHGRGFSRNAIAREIGRSGATITNVCQDLGLTFDRAAVQAATTARKADAAALRSELELQLLDDAQRLRAQIWQPHEYRDHGGKDFVEVKWTQDEPSPIDKLKLMQATGVAIDRAVRLGELDKDDEVEDAKSMLVDLFEALGLAFRGDQPAAETDS